MRHDALPSSSAIADGPPRRLLPRLGAAFFLAAALLVAAGAARAEEAMPRYRLLMESGSPPFSFVNADGKPDGFVVELMRAVAADQGFAVDFDLRPWRPAYADFLAKRGEILGLVAYSRERAAHMDFSAAYVTTICGLYVHRDSAPIRTREELRGKRLAVITDSAAHEFVRHQDWGVKLVPMTTLRECLLAVSRGECDAVVNMHLVTDNTIRTLKLPEVVRGPLVFPELNYQLSFAVQPGQQDLLRRINQGLFNVHHAGIYDTLYERYLGQLEARHVGWRDLRPYLLPVLALLVAASLALVWQRRILGRARAQARALRESEERLSLVIAGSNDGFWDWDLTTGRVTRSPRWAEMLGRTVEEIGSAHDALLALVHPDDRPLLEEQRRVLWSGRDQFELEFRLRTAGGEWKWILDRGKVVRRDPATGQPLRIAGTHTDITARKIAEQENERLNQKMLETQKLESLGVLAGGIAHDFNNLLTVILGNASIIRLDLPPGSANTGRVDKILTASNRAADLCRQLLAYAGKGSIVHERVSLNDVVRETAQLLEIPLARRARLEFALAPALPAIEGDPTQIRQVVMNLVLNASEAITDAAGRIRISTREQALEAGDLTDAQPGGSPPPGRYAVLEVSDTGSGMPREVLQRIFDPFFTTKFAGRGLGLAAVIGIVRSHDGALTVRSAPGQGSVFTLYFPAEPASAETRDHADQPAGPANLAEGVVLVADDEAYVRDLADEILKRAGYTTVLAVDGADAVRLFSENPSRIDALLLDLTMPRLDGAEALRQIRAIRPDVPCVFSSGHSAEDVRARFRHTPHVGFAQKPFTPEVLLDVLRATVAQSR